MTIRREISRLLKYTIPVSESGTKWENAFESLNKEGRITKKVLIDIILVLLKREEARENAE